MTPIDDRRRCRLASIVFVVLAASALGYSPGAHAQSYPLGGGAVRGTVCQQSVCGSVPAGVECLLPLCGTLPPGTPLSAACEYGEFLPACSSVPAEHRLR